MDGEVALLQVGAPEGPGLAPSCIVISLGSCAELMGSVSMTPTKMISGVWKVTGSGSRRASISRGTIGSQSFILMIYSMRLRGAACLRALG